MLVATGYLLLALPVIALARRLERRTGSPGPLMIEA
jgi:hypothetical protein